MPGFRGLETGCLLADVAHVPRITTKLGAIEDKCRPWHHLFAPTVAMGKEREAFAVDAEEFFGIVWTRQPRVPLVTIGTVMEARDDSGWNSPTVDALNEDTDREFDWTGVAETTGEDLARLEPETDAGLAVARFDRERLGELGMRWMMVMDVRDDAASDEHRGRRGR